MVHVEKNIATGIRAAECRVDGGGLELSVEWRVVDWS
jgi:hypothetical protein